MENSNDVVYTPEEVAEKLKVTPNTVRRWLREDDMGGFKVGQNWRVSREDLKDFIQKQRNR